MLPPQARVDLGAMAMKSYSEFPKASVSLESHHQIVIYRTFVGWVGVSYPSAEKQSVYSTDPTYWERTYQALSLRIRVRHWSNGNDGIVHIPQISKAGDSPSNGLMSYLRHFLLWGLPLCRDPVSLFYSTNQLRFKTQRENIVTYVMKRNFA